jgi:phenylalanyl-tRNA synthetase beta chain
MKLSPQWIREFVDITVDNHRLAEDLTAAGIAVEGVSGSGPETVFEMEIGTNRPDAMNHYGVAREAAAIYGVPVKPLPVTPVDGSSRTSDFKIEIDDASGCARYTAQVITGAKILASPDSIVQKLQLVDQRAINNAADASNYTLWEMGHPTHAFDLDLLEGGKIVVRRARAGETLKTLDGVDRKLSSEDLIIADAKKPVGLAGVMGGFDTMITEKTRDILIESAWFDPAAVRKTAKRLGMHTDASHRFERGADFGSTRTACALVAQRITASGGGELVGGPIDVIARKVDQAPVSLPISEVRRILGKSVGVEQVLRLKALGFDLVPEPGDDTEFTAIIPSWRLDVERSIDLIEEIARLHGYDKFPNTLPTFVGAVVDSPEAAKDAKLRATLLALGYNEAVSLSFISAEDAKAFSSVPPIELANPLSDEASVMRTSLAPGMLQMVGYNLNRNVETVRLFEAASVYAAHEATAAQFGRICFAATGQASPAGVHQPARLITFFDLKGDIENLLLAFQYDSLKFEGGAASYYHPEKSARVLLDGAPVAQFGQLHPEVAAARKLRPESGVWIAEIDLDALYEHGLREVCFEPLPRYPAVERDFSFVFDNQVMYAKIEQAIGGVKIPELRSFLPVEMFRGGAVSAGKYSILLRANFQSLERTLRDQEIAAWSEQVVKALQALGGVQRA